MSKPGSAGPAALEPSRATVTPDPHSEANYDEAKVPAYTLPPNREDLAVQRILARHGFSIDLADLLLEDYRRALGHFDRDPVGVSVGEHEGGGFRH